jgi:branched-chain amino acid transport system ATP-binding protein
MKSSQTKRSEKSTWGSNNSTTILELADIHTYYGESYVLHGVSMAVSEGSIVALLGRNGMGKTTSIRSIIGFTPPRAGMVWFKGKDITNLKPYRIAKMGIGLIPQGRKILPSLSVKENLTMAARRRGKAVEWTLDRVYSQFPILEKRAYLKGDLLSGGEQQMLSVGRALMTNPDLLLMDEPSEGLAPKIVRDIGTIIGQLREQGLSILLVEQNLPLALGVSDHVFIISKGRIVYESSPDELEKNEAIKVKYLCAA